MENRWKTGGYGRYHTGPCQSLGERLGSALNSSQLDLPVQKSWIQSRHLFLGTASSLCLVLQRDSGLLLISLSKDLVQNWTQTPVFVLTAAQGRVQGCLPKEFPWAIVGCPAWTQSGGDLRSSIPLGIPCACFVPGGHHGAVEADLQDEAGALQLQTRVRSDGGH